MEAVQMEMAVGENEPKRFSFKHRRVLRDDPLVSAVVTITPAASGLAAGPVTIDGKELLVKLTATILGSFRLKFSGTTTSNAYVVVGYVDCVVTAPPS